MIVDLINLDTEKKSSHELNDAIFGLEPRKDILHRVVTWQLSKRRSGSHKTKTRGEIKGSTRKIMKQKGSGSARHSTRKVNIFRGGGVAFGPLLRDHSTKLPKKIRSLGLKLALSSKAKNKELVVLDELSEKETIFKDLRNKMGKFDLENSLIINDFEKENNFTRAARNIKNIDFLKVEGINVYDILRKEKIVITKGSLKNIEERLQ
ncbi:MAG: 50S ribosomal protein L4 [Rhodobiaceae bacterium]|jgi:large subunit ribosomal protein L4|nr:50S ribosomal protein L4 [Rhodobiaceae bacterium]|tara:strand:- start:43435 stop:44055 length:621 start_codon:yes stop_codon:yes gene_type:complete